MAYKNYTWGNLVGPLHSYQASDRPMLPGSQEARDRMGFCNKAPKERARTRRERGSVKNGQSSQHLCLLIEDLFSSFLRITYFF